MDYFHYPLSIERSERLEDNFMCCYHLYASCVCLDMYVCLTHCWNSSRAYGRTQIFYVIPCRHNALVGVSSIHRGVFIFFHLEMTGFYWHHYLLSGAYPVDIVVDTSGSKYCVSGLAGQYRGAYFGYALSQLDLQPYQTLHI